MEERQLHRDQMHGCKFKISKILHFSNSNLKTCSMPTKYSISSLNDQLPSDRLYITGKPIIISLIQHFEADFLWKVSLKILNSGIILKTHAHHEADK